MSQYTPSLKKREIQRKLFRFVRKSKVKALAGPNLEYLSLYPDNVKAIYTYERDKNIYTLQVNSLLTNFNKRIKNCNNYDILFTPADNSTFYEFDFCTTIKGIDISKYKDCAFMATFCLRNYSREDTLLAFMDNLGESPIETLPIKGSEYYLLKSNKNLYIHTTYKTNEGPPMITIFKFH